MFGLFRPFAPLFPVDFLLQGQGAPIRRGRLIIALRLGLCQFGVQFAQLALLFQFCRPPLVAAQACQLRFQRLGGIRRLLLQFGQFAFGIVYGRMKVVQGGLVQASESQHAGGGGAGDHLLAYRTVLYRLIQFPYRFLRPIDPVLKGFDPRRPFGQVAQSGQTPPQGRQHLHGRIHRVYLFARHTQIIVDIDRHARPCPSRPLRPFFGRLREGFLPGGGLLPRLRLFLRGLCRLLVGGGRLLSGFFTRLVQFGGTFLHLD